MVKSVKIWRDKWLSSLISFHVQSPISLLSSDIGVQELISTDSFTQNCGLISQIFNTEEAETIFKITLSFFRVEDKLLWWPTKKNYFSVKLAYFLEMQGHTLNYGESLNHETKEKF